jgi:hypothetical protein
MTMLANTAARISRFARSCFIIRIAENPLVHGHGAGLLRDKRSLTAAR